MWRAESFPRIAQSLFQRLMEEIDSRLEEESTGVSISEDLSEPCPQSDLSEPCPQPNLSEPCPQPNLSEPCPQPDLPSPALSLICPSPALSLICPSPAPSLNGQQDYLLPYQRPGRRNLPLNYYLVHLPVLEMLIWCYAGKTNKTSA